MRYIVDHDLHIHTKQSLCSLDEEQNTTTILNYGLENGYHTICLTDHMWDDAVPMRDPLTEEEPYWTPRGFYTRQNYQHVKESLPLPKNDRIRYLFGCETELEYNMNLGISKKVMDELDFVIIPTTHLHFPNFTCHGDEGVDERAKLWVTRFEGVLDMDLPFHKIGIAHLTCALVYEGHHIEVLQSIPEREYRRLFAKAATLGVGIELNFNPNSVVGERLETVLLPYRIAKEEGCKFYFGSDAHHPKTFENAKSNFEKIVDLLKLEESDKFAFVSRDDR